jgi:cell division protein FtsB
MAGTRFLDPSSIPLKRQSGGNIWATLVQITQAVIIIVILSGLMLFFLPVIQKTHHLQEEKADLQRRIAAALEEQDQLQTQTEHMKNDPAYVEHIARDQLNMGRPGETILMFDSYKVLGPATPRTITAEPAGEATDTP